MLIKNLIKLFIIDEPQLFLKREDLGTNKIKAKLSEFIVDNKTILAIISFVYGLITLLSKPIFELLKKFMAGYTESFTPSVAISLWIIIALILIIAVNLLAVTISNGIVMYNRKYNKVNNTGKSGEFNTSFIISIIIAVMSVSSLVLYKIPLINNFGNLLYINNIYIIVLLIFICNAMCPCLLFFINIIVSCKSYLIRVAIGIYLVSALGVYVTSMLKDNEVSPGVTLIVLSIVYIMYLIFVLLIKVYVKSYNRYHKKTYPGFYKTTSSTKRQSNKLEKNMEIQLKRQQKKQEKLDIKMSKQELILVKSERDKLKEDIDKLKEELNIYKDK